MYLFISKVMKICIINVFYWKLPYDPSCPSVGWPVGWSVCMSVGLSVIISSFASHAPNGALV